jgi:hypothetical protein
MLLSTHARFTWRDTGAGVTAFFKAPGNHGGATEITEISFVVIYTMNSMMYQH